VHFEPYEHPNAAIAREKQIKGWLREKKVALIEASNPTCEDLAADWFEAAAAESKRKAGPSLRSG
jgi:putative endonuclease